MSPLARSGDKTPQAKYAKNSHWSQHQGCPPPAAVMAYAASDHPSEDYTCSVDNVSSSYHMPHARREMGLLPTKVSRAFRPPAPASPTSLPRTTRLLEVRKATERITGSKHGMVFSLQALVP